MNKLFSQIGSTQPLLAASQHWDGAAFIPTVLVFLLHVTEAST